MRIYLVTTDYYFFCGLVSICHQNNVEVIAIELDAVRTLCRDYRLSDSDTLVLALDTYRGRMMEFITGLKMLSSLKMKIVLVSESLLHIRRAGGYNLSKCSPFSDYMKVFTLPCQTYAGFIRALPLSGRDTILLDAFYRGVPEEVMCRLAGGDTRKIYGYKAQILRRLGIRRFNHLYQMF